MVDSAYSKELVDAALQEKRCTSEGERWRDDDGSGPVEERCSEGNIADQIESVNFKGTILIQCQLDGCSVIFLFIHYFMYLSYFKCFSLICTYYLNR